MVVSNEENKDTQNKIKSRYRIEIVRENGVVEFYKVGFSEVRDLFNKAKEAGKTVTVREGLINLIMDKAIELSELKASDADVKRITLIPDSDGI